MSNYILVDGVPTKEPDILKWAKWLEGANRVVEKTMIGRGKRFGEVRISTVFLGIDHQFGNGPPLLFETMIFGGEHDEDQWRYTTLGDAKRSHFRIVAALQAGNSPHHEKGDGDGE